MDKNYQYYKQEALEVTTVMLNREEAKEFLSIFENIDARIEQFWIHSKPMKIFEEVANEKVENMFYHEDQEERKKARDDVVSKFIEKRNKGLFNKKSVCCFWE